MKGLTSGRLTRWLWGASLMLLAFAASFPTEARGDCGHAVPALAHFDELVAAGAMPEAEAPVDRSHPPAPCTGPMCSKAPAAPSAPAATTFVVEPWACLSDRMPISIPPRPLLLPFEFGQPVPVPGGSSVFHPPRTTLV